MEIIKTHIIIKRSSTPQRFVKVYETIHGRYFEQVAQGAISEITQQYFEERLLDT